MGLIVVCSCNRPTTVGRSRKEGVRLALTSRLPHCRHRGCGKPLRLHPDQIVFTDVVRQVRAELRRRK